ncbi:DUF6541 family protein [Pedococcus sp. 5OH_020]|uniref:DUF6541 family protein n=1 Tax=Pedococcus sp. 5OH_020 TaxID=2989814 RepID=UPI0022E9C526|nr:DUF6541 family protein [Pedococcus sp. 5OH_020]
MGLGSTTWWQAAPVVAVAATLLFGPGTAAARVAGHRWQDAVALGPVLTAGALAATGVAAGAGGLAWGAAPLLLGLVILMLGALLVRRLGGRPEAQGAGAPWSLVVALCLGAVAVISAVVTVTGSPSAFPQSPDTIYHLGTIRWMLEQHDVSALHAGGFASVDGSGFYPALFHGLAATVAMTTGCSPVVAASTTALVIAAFAWPSAVVLLARRVVGTGWAPTVGAGVASAVFPAFPFWLLGYGVLWPNVFGQALLPAALVLLIDAAQGPGRIRALLLLAIATPGLALAHPNAVFAFGLMGMGVVLGALLRAARRDRRERGGRAVVWLALAALGPAVLAGGWAALTARSVAMRASNPPGPEMSARDAVVDVLFFGPRDLAPLWVVGVLVLLGAVVLLVGRRGRWLVLAHAGIAVLYFLDTAVDSERTRVLTWPWYNNSPRLAALMTVTAAVLLAAALAAGAELVTRRLPRLSPPVAPLLVALLLVALTGGLAWGQHRAALGRYFDRPEAESYASDAAIDALRALGRRMPAKAVVAADPWKGGPYLYLASGQRLLFPTEKAWSPGDRALLGRRLDKASSDPTVCEAVRRQKVGWVITGGTTALSSPGQRRRYAGIDAVPGARGFTPVAGAGDYRLWRVGACW